MSRSKVGYESSQSLFLERDVKVFSDYSKYNFLFLFDYNLSVATIIMFDKSIKTMLIGDNGKKVA
jgi:hypothetical protein